MFSTNSRNLVYGFGVGYGTGNFPCVMPVAEGCKSKHDGTRLKVTITVPEPLGEENRDGR